MKRCPQTEIQSVYQHGESVRDHTFKLISILKTGVNDYFKLPEWFMQYRFQILERLYPEEIIEEYTLYHDCGKIYCLTYDENGRRHFPNHAEISYKTWLSVGGNAQ